MIAAILWPVLTAIVAWHFWDASAHMWLSASFAHPMGTDEYGRDLLATTCVAILVSGVKGTLLAGLALAVGGATGYVIAMHRWRAVAWTVARLTLVIESVPLFLWLLVLIVALRHPVPVLILVFTIGTLPFVSRVVAGEIERWKREPFIDASRIAGASAFEVTWRHILPNAMPVLGPVAIQIVGAAAAADGVFGLVGLSNRMQLDIGTLLLRGKENALVHPFLLLVALGAIGLLYLYLWTVSKAWDRAGRRYEVPPMMP